MMATAVQKNNLKGLPNGNGLVHQPLNGYGEVQEVCAPVETLCAPEQAAAPVSDSAAEEPEIDIMINNVVCSFSVRCHLNLREIALNGINVEYRKENGKITMKLRRPYTTASIWSSGKVTCTGATSETQAKIAARRFARCLQKLGFKVRFNNSRVVNVLGTCSMPFAIKINSFSERHKEADYEPELHPGVTYKLLNPKATLKIFSTGSVTVTAPSVADVQAAIEYIFPLVYEFRKERTPEEIAQLALKKQRQMGHCNSPAFDDEYQEDEESDWD
jgi:transcription initiation factor TFIID TATA-box-binding protein